MTETEAALPASSKVGFAGVSTEDGPVITIVKPGDGATVTSGFPLQIRFSAAGGGSVVLSSIKLFCLKQQPINLTERIWQHILPSGINIDHVLLPPGDYRLRVSLADSLGQRAEREFSIKVTTP